MKKKYLFIQLEIKDGERGYYTDSVHRSPVNSDMENYANEYAKSFWSDGGTKESNGYLHCGGEVYVEVNRVQEITKEEYIVLNKYL